MAQGKNTPKSGDEIDQNLKRIYRDTLEEAVPDRFLDLLEQLRAQDASGGDTTRDDGEDGNKS